MLPLVFWGVSSALADEVDLVDAVAMAIAGDERIAAARAEFDATLETRIEARSYRLPRLNAIGEASARQAGDLNAGGIQQRDGERFSGGLEVTHDLYSFGRNRAHSDRSLAQISIAELELLAITQEVAMEVVSAWYNVLKAEQLGQLRERHTADLGELLEATRAQFEEDLVTATDLALVRSRALQAGAHRAVAEANYRVQLETLRTLADNPVLTPNPANLEIYRSSLPPSLQMAVEESLLRSPAIQIARSQELSSRADLDLRKADLFPRIVARGAWVQGQVGEFSSDERELGISINVPLFDGGLKRSWARRAEQNVNRSRILLDGIVRKKRDEIQISWTEYRAAQSVEASWAAALEAEHESLEGIRETIKEDLLSVIYLLEARDGMVQVEIAAIESQTRVHTSAFHLLFDIGSILIALDP